MVRRKRKQKNLTNNTSSGPTFFLGFDYFETEAKTHKKEPLDFGGRNKNIQGLCEIVNSSKFIKTCCRNRS